MQGVDCLLLALLPSVRACEHKQHALPAQQPVALACNAVLPCSRRDRDRLPARLDRQNGAAVALASSRTARPRQHQCSCEGSTARNSAGTSPVVLEGLRGVSCNLPPSNPQHH